MEKREVTIADLFVIAIKWLWVILIGMVVFGISAFYFSKFHIIPMYSSTSRFLVQSKAVYSQQTQSSQQLLEEQRAVALSQMIVTEYIEILDTRFFADELALYVRGNHHQEDSPEKLEAIKEAGKVKGEYSATTLEKMLSFESKEASAAFSVKVVGMDSHDVYVIAKYVEIVMGDYLKKKNPGAGHISVIDGALENTSPINNKTVALTLIGVIAGAALAYVVVYIIDINDTRVKDEKELVQIFSTPVIGSIPDCASTLNSSAYQKHTKSNK